MIDGRRIGPRPGPEIQQSLNYCRKEGVAAQVMMSLVDTYLVPFGLFLGASTQQIGALVAIPNLIASLSQLGAVRVIGWAGNRLRLILGGIALQAFLLIPVGLLPFVAESSLIAVLIVLILLHRVIGNLIGPAWGSLVSDYLPDNQRGGYFGRRLRLIGIAGVIAVCISGVVLSFFKKVSPAMGFAVLFASAAAARLVSLFYMSKMVDLPLVFSKESHFTFYMFLRRFRESNFVKFVFYISGITFGTYVSAAYFSVYMLRDLQFDYLTYTVIMLSAVVAGNISFPHWGNHADAVGNATILKITGICVSFIPVMWLFSTNIVYLIIIEFVAGFLWGGFNLCTTNFIYDAVSPDKRVRCLGYFNLINGTAIFCGALLGGYLADRLPPFMGYRLYTLFCLSTVLRLSANLFLSRHFKEVRVSAQKVSSRDLFFSVLGIKPLNNP